jgi:hypothetical protein
MIFHNCVIFTLVSLHVALNFVFKLIKISFICVVIGRDLFFEVIGNQLFITETVLYVAQPKSGIRPV